MTKNTDGLPTWDDIFNVTYIADKNVRYKKSLEMMQLVENRGYGNSKERWALDLIVNYGRSAEHIQARLWNGNRIGAAESLLKSYQE